MFVICVEGTTRSRYTYRKIGTIAFTYVKMIFIYFTGIGILLCFTYFGETSLDYESSHVRVFNNINRAGRKVAAIF